ncbi:sigma-54-dependent Fis family transcriptional regulator [Bacillus aquiflavi]|uniref:Sigma-54-dependent Fis family transcriptional regulator n=2 Tax=Bacillus aquiflavi TaxID=2672567 RepID=A0A6B3VZ06_9BACI|nr:sigma-54-dependent Fis family transcriptional regulator [Bacillus aquiflavi]NEY81515.1 sigma-54-dependent Fis family transcriptional regulator [Bacillus aquiflavi]UAC49994.1 sigma-54-dependent Fis family transcriptional regulator [Bacillus aquiflavi]
MKELESKWEDFIVNKRKPEKIRTTILQSWERCQNYNLNPRQKQTPVLISNEKLTEIINKSQLYHASLPVLKELYHQIDCTGHLITLCDEKGRIIYLQGNSSTISLAQKMNFTQGADWSEKAAGSNAIGTCIAVEQPIQIFSFEHYCEGVHPWVCSAAPIKDPLTGKTLGVIDLTGPSDLAQPHSLSLVQNIAMMIQQQLFSTSNKTRQYLEQCYGVEVKKWKSNRIILLDEMLNVVHAGSECKPLLQIDHWSELLFRPEFHLLKTSILTSDEQEQELHLPSLQLILYIRSIILESKRIGFLLQLEKRNERQPFISSDQRAWKHLIGQSSSLKQLIHQAQVVAPTNVPVLLTGESGTGKEVFANAIHKESSRHDSPFIAINCGAIHKELIASELFGYEPGAFTGGKRDGKKGKFEEANGGTLFLDEVGEMPLELQVHLLRVLQEKEIVRLGSSRPLPVDVRIIAATNKNLTSLIDKGEFRLDLYYRLNVVELILPSLQERKEDIPLLCRYFTMNSANTHNRPVPEIDRQVLAFFRHYDWPGNIRELKNIIEYAVLFCKNNRITLDSLPKKLLNNSNVSSTLTPLEAEEKRKIEQLLLETGRNLSEVARRCEIARTTLYRKIQKYQL